MDLINVQIHTVFKIMNMYFPYEVYRIELGNQLNARIRLSQSSMKLGIKPS